MTRECQAHPHHLKTFGQNKVLANFTLLQQRLKLGSIT